MIEIPSTGVPIKAWVEGVQVEDDAKTQLRNVASLPVVWPHVAVMPDVHLGYGATVGSVIPTRGAIIPSAVGVDIGCVDADSEYLSPTGWHRIADYDGGQVMQYEPEGCQGRFVVPTNYIKKESKGFLHFKTKYGIDQMLSPDHRVLVWKITGRKRERICETITADQLAKIHERLVIGAKYEFKTTFDPIITTNLKLSDAALRVQVAVMADGYIRNYDTGNTVVKLKKVRKIERLEKLLQLAEIQYTRNTLDDVTSFSFNAPIATKTYKDFWKASLSQLELISEECLHWDGNWDDRVYFTRDKDSADFMQYAMTASGHRAVLRIDYKDGEADYRVFANENLMVGLGGSPKSEIKQVPSVDGLEYCFTVPSGYWVMRRNGNVVMTGNCGMQALKTNLKANDLPDTLAHVRTAIEEVIPHGRTNNGGFGDKGAWNNDPPKLVQEKWNVMNDAYRTLCAKHPFMLAYNTFNHLGTLGTGNHFVEVCLDKDQNVWIMLHSGSRGVGNKIGQYFIELAKKDMEAAHGTMPTDTDLCYLNEGTEHFDDYVDAVYWAQEYALHNRDIMMERATYALARSLGKTVYGVEGAVACHHNYVQKEHHFGEDVYVTRKGAVNAERGKLGIIPGSMGARSFIVRGLGNPESFNSCSHGAGRKMSRNAAKKAFTLKDHEEATKGIECRKDAGVIDETPGAYKSIDDVMNAQRDLVEVVAELHQVLCVKG